MKVENIAVSVYGCITWIKTRKKQQMFSLYVCHHVQSLRRKRGRNTVIVVVSRRIAVDSPPFWWKII